MQLASPLEASAPLVPLVRDSTSVVLQTVQLCQNFFGTRVTRYITESFIKDHCFIRINHSVIYLKMLKEDRGNIAIGRNKSNVVLVKYS